METVSGRLQKEGRTFRKSLRNAAINYRNGWFFVTCQAAHNKCVFGAIVGERCELNPFGREVLAYWRAMPERHPELELDEHVLMPNHFHAIARIRWRPTNREHHLGFLMGRFKGGTGHLYGMRRRDGEIMDIGEHLWQFDYWDRLISREGQLAAIRRYIRENPANWTRDRFGAVTRFSFGNMALLDAPRVAFVASQGFAAADLRPRCVWSAGERAKARRPDIETSVDSCRSDIEMSVDSCRPDIGAPADPRTDVVVGDIAKNADARPPAQGESYMEPVVESMNAHPPAQKNISERGALAPVVISTFTSAQEREMLRRALAHGRRIIHVVPQGIPPENAMPPALLAACRAGRALLLSPQPAGSSMNKKSATWCNEYVMRHAREIWAGGLSPNGMLATLLKAIKGKDFS